MKGNQELGPVMKRWLIACDESGTHGGRYYGFGTIWMAWQRRGDFAEAIREIRKRHPVHKQAEMKWQHVNRATLPMYQEVVRYFFREPALAFHCLLVEQALVDKALHANDDEARQKHLVMLLKDKIRRSLRLHRDKPQTFRVWADPIASGYAKADELVAIITNHVLARLVGQRPLDTVLTKDSRETPQIQLCDVLLGAVIANWQKEPIGPAKQALQKELAMHLGWADLKADTMPDERKFNIWTFHDNKRPRRVATRPVVLRYPLPASRKPKAS
jgi:hypothetical protein